MPTAMFIYAWSSFKFVPWVALTIGITLYIWATFIIYLAGFNYIADWWVTSRHEFPILICLLISSYGPFASSAIAGQSLASEFYSFLHLHRNCYSSFLLWKEICLRLHFHCLPHKCTMPWITNGLILSSAVSHLFYCPYLSYVLDHSLIGSVQ